MNLKRLAWTENVKVMLLQSNRIHFHLQKLQKLIGNRLSVEEMMHLQPLSSGTLTALEFE